MFKDKKFKLFIAFLALFICISQLKDTYAKYLEAKEGNTDFTIANWKIVVNDKDISEGSTMSSLITPVYVANQNIASGVIAPSSEGYFDLNIDASKTEVSFKYDISVSTSDDSAVSDLKVTSYSIDGGEQVPVEGVSTISNTINYTATKKNIVMRVYFKWIDDDTGVMDNKADTKASIDGNNAKLKVNLSFTQVV